MNHIDLTPYLITLGTVALLAILLIEGVRRDLAPFLGTKPKARAVRSYTRNGKKVRRHTRN